MNGEDMGKYYQQQYRVMVDDATENAIPSIIRHIEAQYEASITAGNIFPRLWDEPNITLIVNACIARLKLDFDQIESATWTQWLQAYGQAAPKWRIALTDIEGLETMSATLAQRFPDGTNYWLVRGGKGKGKPNIQIAVYCALRHAADVAQKSI